MDFDAVETLQRTFCINRDSGYVPAAPESKLGLAISTLGKIPVNGLRHPPGGRYKRLVHLVWRRMVVCA